MLFLTISAATETTPKAQTLSYEAMQNNSSISFKAIGRPSAIRINGKAVAPQCSFMQTSNNKVTGLCTIKLNDFDTGIELRNKHMREKYLETEKYPTAIFVLDELNATKLLSNHGQTTETIPFKGKLNFHGVEKPVLGSCTIQKNVDTALAIAKFGIEISDYNITIPSFMGITVAKEIEIQAELTIYPKAKQ